ncbi:MAG TPA: RNA-binding protein [Dissulfurispiraceae bacterium]|nr:RNA-binding protein [Dissulfurispiraceae bacterium]
MSKRIYVGNLPYQADEEALKEIFAAIGEVQSVRIIKDETGRSKGFGFVEMTSDDDADSAISSLNGTPFMGRNIVVNEARPQTGRGRPGGPGGGGQKKGYGRGRESESWR